MAVKGKQENLAGTSAPAPREEGEQEKADNHESRAREKQRQSVGVVCALLGIVEHALVKGIFQRIVGIDRENQVVFCRAARNFVEQQRADFVRRLGQIVVRQRIIGTENRIAAERARLRIG